MQSQSKEAAPKSKINRDHSFIDENLVYLLYGIISKRMFLRNLKFRIKQSLIEKTNLNLIQFSYHSLITRKKQFQLRIVYIQLRIRPSPDGFIQKTFTPSYS